MNTQRPTLRGPGTSGCSGHLGVLALAVLLGGCAAAAPQSVVIRDPLVTGCPPGSLRTCEVIGGNKFKKRYGRCICAHR